MQRKRGLTVNMSKPGRVRISVTVTARVRVRVRGINRQY